MKRYEYKEISLGGVAGTIQIDRASELSNLGKEGWRLVDTFSYYHGEGPSFIELRGLIEREIQETEVLLGSKTQRL